MNWYYLIGAIAWLGTVAAAVWGGYHWGAREAEESARARGTQGLAPVRKDKTDSNPMVCPPPMVGDETVMQWGLRTYRGRPELVAANVDPEYGVWSLMVRDVYTEASQDLGVARHFNFTDMAALQEKFTATLTLVFDKGLREKAIKKMGEVHADFDITPAEYDRVVAILGRVLKRYRVPAEAFPAVEKIVVTLKPVIAKSVRVA